MKQFLDTVEYRPVPVPVDTYNTFSNKTAKSIAVTIEEKELQPTSDRRGRTLR